MPTIVRFYKHYWKVITIAALIPEDLKAVDSYGLPNDFNLPAITIFPHDFLLVWDWNIVQDQSKRGHYYEAQISELASRAPEPGLQHDLELITRYWHSGMALRRLDRPVADETLGYALVMFHCLLEEMTSNALDDPIQAYSMQRGDMRYLQGIVGLLSGGESGHISLCMAAGYGYETIVRLLLDTYNVDPDAGRHQLGHKVANDNRTPLSLAAENGHEAIVQLLIDTKKVDLEARSFHKDRTPLAYAAQNGHLGIIKLLLNTGKVNLDPRQDRVVRFSTESALTIAVRGGHKTIVEVLLGAGMMDYEHYGDQRRLLSWAKKHGYREIAELLRNASKSENPLS